MVTQLTGIMPEMQTWYFTFGSNTNLAQNYMVVKAWSMEDARKIMFQKQGVLWGFQYSEQEFLPQITEYKLTEVPLGTRCERVR
jgi:hypothetical protein